jgi:rod shape determining protein RodA
VRERLQNFLTYGDLLGTSLFLGLLIFGAVIVQSATLGMYFNTSYHMMLVAFALIAFILAVFVPYEIWIEYSFLLYGLCLLALLLVFIPHVGKVVAGSRSWIYLGPVGFQPSEFAKVATVLTCAAYVKDLSGKDLGYKEMSIIAALVGVPVMLTFIEPDFGTATTFLPILAAGIYFSRMSLAQTLKWAGIALVAAFLLFALGWFTFFKPYQKDRVLTYLNPAADPRGAGYQVNQARIAVGSGEVVGKGLYSGTQNRLNFLPAPHTDFIFGVVAEETGFLGSTAVLVGFFALLWRLLGTIKVARDPEGRFLVMCAFAVLLYHVTINVGMVLGLLPTTGVPLPFLSYGGSFLVSMSLLVGLCVNVRTRRFLQ